MISTTPAGWVRFIDADRDPSSWSHERLGQIHRIVNHRNQRQVVAVSHEVFREHGLVASRNPVAANPSHLQMGGRHSQHVPVPFARRKTLPGVGGVWRMRTVIQIVRSAAPTDVRMNDGLKLGPRTRARCAGSRPARQSAGCGLLMLGGVGTTRPAVAAGGRPMIGNQIIADIRRNSLGDPEPRRPFTRKIGADRRAGIPARASEPAERLTTTCATNSLPGMPSMFCVVSFSSALHVPVTILRLSARTPDGQLI